jgi:hypothetical protein
MNEWSPNVGSLERAWLQPCHKFLKTRYGAAEQLAEKLSALEVLKGHGFSHAISS